MTKDTNRFHIVFICILFVGLLTGCFNKQSNTSRLYFEPPLSLIGDYTGMAEDEEINWAWFTLGDRFGHYRSVTIKPFKNLTSINDQNVSEQLSREVIQWFKENGFEVSDDGEMVCEGALVDLKLERDFLNKYNPLYEDMNDLRLEVELVMTQQTTGKTISKIRHGVTGYKIDQLVKRLSDDLGRYFESHK